MLKLRRFRDRREKGNRGWQGDHEQIEGRLAGKEEING